MALIKRVLLFFLFLVGIIVLLIGATTSYSQDVFMAETTVTKTRFYTIEWIEEADDLGKKYVCGTKLSTYDLSGKKYIIEYYYLLKSNDEIVSQFTVDALQLSVENPDTAELKSMDIKLYASILSKDGKGFLAGIRGPDDTISGVGAEYTEFDREGTTAILKTMYKGGFVLEVHTIPNSPITIPIEVNTEYTKEKELILDNCIVDLINNQKHRIQSYILIDKLVASRVG